MRRVTDTNVVVIVTGDHDLLTLKTHQDIPIVSAAEALRRVGNEK